MAPRSSPRPCIAADAPGATVRERPTKWTGQALRRPRSAPCSAARWNLHVEAMVERGVPAHDRAVLAPSGAASDRPAIRSGCARDRWPTRCRRSRTSPPMADQCSEAGSVEAERPMLKPAWLSLRSAMSRRRWRRICEGDAMGGRRLGFGELRRGRGLLGVAAAGAPLSAATAASQGRRTPDHIDEPPIGTLSSGSARTSWREPRGDYTFASPNANARAAEAMVITAGKGPQRRILCGPIWRRARRPCSHAPPRGCPS